MPDPESSNDTGNVQATGANTSAPANQPLSASPEGGTDTFSRTYVEKLRRENQALRAKANEADSAKTAAEEAKRAKMVENQEFKGLSDSLRKELDEKNALLESLKPKAERFEAIEKSTAAKVEAALEGLPDEDKALVKKLPTYVEQLKMAERLQGTTQPAQELPPASPPTSSETTIPDFGNLPPEEQAEAIRTHPDAYRAWQKSGAGSTSRPSTMLGMFGVGRK